MGCQSSKPQASKPQASKPQASKPQQFISPSIDTKKTNEMYMAHKEQLQNDL
jgi:hypothetical protein